MGLARDHQGLAAYLCGSQQAPVQLQLATDGPAPCWPRPPVESLLYGHRYFYPIWLDVPNLPCTQSSAPAWTGSYRDVRHQAPCKELIPLIGQIARGQQGGLFPGGPQSAVFLLCPFQFTLMRTGKVTT